jgi:hypothetical protein
MLACAGDVPGRTVVMLAHTEFISIDSSEVPSLLVPSAAIDSEATAFSFLK